MLDLPKQPFNFDELLQIILDAKAEDVTEELKTGNNFNVNYQGSTHPQYKKTLREALEEFRKYFAPRVIKHGEMHFNYASLQKAFDLYNEQFDKLYETSGNNWDKRNLFWRQVIGYIERGLPAGDRQAFARDLSRIVSEKKSLKRRFDFKYDGGSFFPITAFDLSRSGLGYDYVGWPFVCHGVSLIFQTYVKQKYQTCKTYAATPTRESSVYNFLN